MINQRFFQVLLTILLLLPGYSSAQGISTTSTDQYCIPKEFIRASGRQLVVGPEDTPVRLKGVCFGNEVWGNPATPPAKHHVERDYARVREMKMNVIRFYLNYGLFEDDRHPYKYKASGWAWLDRNIRWAKKNGVYLILNMHYPQGGFQSNGEGMALWDQPENQDRLVALWQAIAKRYKEETIIAGYDLVNEPIAYSLKDWETLAKRLVSAIREVDPHHLIIVERLNGVKGDWPTYDHPNFFLIPDPNIAYTFHFYHPFEFTHQNTSWTGMPADGSYPDESVLMVPADTRWYTATFDNPTIPPGNTGWRFYRGKKYQVTDPNILVGKPAFVSKNNAGTVYLADFVIEEYDEDGDYLGKVCEGEISTLDGWFYWSADGSGRMRLGKGKNGHRAIKISGTRDDANASNNNYRFSVTPGHSYTISGYMKGVRVSRGATCRLRIDFETSPTRGELHYKNKEYLNHRLQPFIEFGRTNNVPLYLGEFGLYRDCFLAEKGGLNWVRDMVELMNKYGLSYTYHAYHEYSFGIYQDGACLPSDATANKGLIELFSMINSE